MVQKFIIPITLGEYFPPEFFNKGMVTSTHMVSCHEILEEDEPDKDEENAFGAESSKTKEDDEVVTNLQCLLITTQKEHILDNNSHEFHIFWVVIMPKTLN